MSKIDGRWKLVKAHRVAWEHHVGPIPDGACVLHKCDVPHCVNPAHLFVGTQGDNVRDMKNKQRHAFGEAHPLARLTENDVRDIRSSSLSGAALARHYKVTPTAICDIKKRKLWKHI